MPTRRYGTEKKTVYQGREQGNVEGNKDGGGDGNDDEDRNEHENRDGGENGNGNGDNNADKGGRETEPVNLCSGRTGGSEDARGETTPPSNHRPRRQGPTPQQDHRIILSTQGREARDRIGEGGVRAEKRKKPQRRCRQDVGNAADLGG